MIRRTAAIIALTAALPAGAEPAVGDCDGWQAHARNVDWSQPTPTYANGAIRLVALDTVEPAAAAFHLMVLLPDADDMFLDCRLVSANLEGVGFAGVDLQRADATYDPSRGLTVTVPVSHLSAGEDFVETSMSLVINQARGTVTATLQE